MSKQRTARVSRSSLPPFVLAALLQLAPMRRAGAEDRLDFKTMYYVEDDDRMKILAPSILYEKDLSPTLTIKIDGIYNSISGATPTGAPAESTPASSGSGSGSSSSPVVTTPSGGGGGGGDDEGEDDAKIHPYRIGRFHALAGATPTSPPTTPSSPSSGGGSSPSSPSSSPSTPSTPTTPATPSGKSPTTEVDDERTAINIELTKKLDRHTVGAQFSYSTESDYESTGLALKDAIDFNQKNTTLLLGLGGTHDRVDTGSRATTESKDSVDAMIGLTQVLTPTTLFTVNLTLGLVDGFLDDPYKVVELNGALVPENRPDSKDKFIVFLSLSQFIEPLDGSAELSYRFYDDSYGIRADTVTLAWYQKLGRHFVLRPSVRLYQQDEADFYGTRFTGSPEFYSADYRVSALRGTSYGLKLIWTPNSRVSFDAAYERYEQKGTDGVTPDDMYPSANVYTVGMRVWF